MSERDLSRRDFMLFSGKAAAGAASLVFPNPEINSSLEADLVQPVIYEHKEGRLRVKNTSTSRDHATEDRLHAEFNDGSLPAPANNMCWCTRHGDTAYVNVQVITKAQEALRLEPDISKHPRDMQNVIKIYEAMLSANLPSDTQTPEYAEGFRNMLRRVDFGPEYRGVEVIASGAIKGLGEVGRIFRCKVFDRLTGQWISHYVNPEGQVKELALIVMDTQGDDSWQNYQPDQLENFVHGDQNQPVLLPWGIEASHDLFTSAGMGDTQLERERGEYLILEEIVPILNVGVPMFPTVYRENIITPQYQHLADLISHLFRDPEYTQEIHRRISAKQDQSLTTNTSDFIFEMIAEVGRLPSFTNDNLDNIKAAVTGHTELGVGIPVGSGTQAMLFTLLGDSDQIPYRSIVRDREVDLSQANTGYFYTQTYAGAFVDKTWHVCGIFVNTGNEQYFAYVQEGGLIRKVTKEQLIEEHFIYYDTGNVDRNKRAVIFG